ncbi:hypothetical protein ACS0TY_005831 [Phlomoides rotata]
MRKICPTRSTMTITTVMASDPVPVTALINLCNIKLTTSTYLLWNHKVRTALSSFDLLGFIDGSTKMPPPIVVVDDVSAPNPAFISWRTKDQRNLLHTLG